MKTTKIISLLTTLIFTISLLCFAPAGVSAAGELTEAELFQLKSFDIVQGDENGNLNLENNITRAEFTKVIARLMDIDAESIGFAAKTDFADVEKDHWAYSYIALSSALGYINGNGNGYFYPENNITFNEAVKILVSVLGYGDEAVKRGGYPDGYIACAGEIHLLKNVSANGNTAINREIAFKLVYNSLDADRIVSLSYGDGGEQGISDKTLRDILMGKSDDGLSKFKGIVTANYDTWLNAPLPSIEKNEVEIEGLLFDKGTTNAEEFLGMEVEIYASITPESSRPVIKSIRPTSNNEVTEIEIDDLESFDRNGAQYSTDDGKTLTKKNFKNSTAIVYNGRMTDDVSSLNVMSMTSGTVKMISTTSNSDIQTVFINEYMDYRVDSVNTRDERIILNANDRFRGQKYINLNEDKYDVKPTLKNTAGEEISLEEVKKDDIISVYASLDGMVLKIFSCDEDVSGKVSSLNYSEDEIYIDGVLYEYEKGAAVEGTIGKNVIASLNYRGKIAFIENDTDISEQYGAIVELKLSNKVDKNLMVQMLVPGKIVDDEQDNDDDPTSTAIPLIAAQNREILTLTFNSKVEFDDVMYSDNEALMNAINSEIGVRGYLPVSYTVNSAGFINKIDSLEEYTFLQYKKQYNGYEKTFSGTGGAFGLDSKTVAICIPTNDISSSNDYLARIEMNHKENYYVNAYQYNEDTHCPDVVVFRADMYYKTSGIANDGKKIGLIENVNEFADENKEIHKNVVMATADGINTYVVSNDTVSGSGFDSLKAGDLILYSLDSKDQLDGFNKLESVNPIPSDYKDTKSGFDVFSGTAVDAEYKVVSNNLNKWVDTVTVTGNGLDETIFEVKRDNPPPIYIWNTKNKKVSMGTTDDFLADQQHIVVVKDKAEQLLVRAVVIII